MPLYLQVQQVDNEFRSALSTLTVHVTDINDNRPLFQTTVYGPVSIAEHTLQNTTVVVVTAIDRDVVQHFFDWILLLVTVIISFTKDFKATCLIRYMA